MLRCVSNDFKEGFQICFLYGLSLLLLFFSLPSLFGSSYLNFPFVSSFRQEAL